MDVVSFEKAKELKAAGFPQEHAFKKVYWEVDCKDDKGNVFKTFKICVYMLGYMAMPYLVPLEFRAEHIIPDYENIYFAPDFLDLMRQLPHVKIDLNDNLKCDDLADMWLKTRQ